MPSGARIRCCEMGQVLIGQSCADQQLRVSFESKVDISRMSDLGESCRLGVRAPEWAASCHAWGRFDKAMAFRVPHQCRFKLVRIDGQGASSASTAYRQQCGNPPINLAFDPVDFFLVHFDLVCAGRQFPDTSVEGENTAELHRGFGRSHGRIPCRVTPLFNTGMAGRPFIRVFEALLPPAAQ